MLSTRKYFTVGVVSFVGASLLLSGCSTAKDVSGASATTKSGASRVSEKDKPFALPGLKPGQIPDIPSIEVPDISLMLASSDQFNIDAEKRIQSAPGVKVEPAKCDGTELSYDNGTLAGDGSGSFWTAGKNVTNNGDGSGTYSKGGVEIQNNGDGSGSYFGNGLSIDVDGKGGGTYTKGDYMVMLEGDGSGSYNKGSINIENNGDGSGSYSKGSANSHNNGDGSGAYDDPNIQIDLKSDGTATVFGTNGKVKDFKVKPLKPVDPAGKFGTMDSIAPIKSCGTKITLANDILFGIEKSNITSNAKATLKSVATVFKQGKVPAVKVYGHTDSVNSDDANQALSEERAQAVADYLEGQGVSSSIEAVGMGEKHPIAKNTNKDGSPNLAGRAQNRRVEIFVPTF